MTTEKLSGLIAPVFTPMQENGEIRTDVIADYAGELIANHISGVFVCGSSGEGMLLGVEERQQIVEAWAPFADQLKLIVHVGCTAYKDAQLLAKHAQKQGAWAISSMGPVFLQPQHIPQLVEYCAKISSAAPDLPFYYYHMPVRTNITLSMPDFLVAGSKTMPNLAGIKYSHTNFMEMHQCLMLDNGKYDIVHGHDEVLLCGLSLGIKAAIGVTYNFIPGLYHQIIASYNCNNMKKAREYQAFSVKLMEVIKKFGGGIPTGKAIQTLCGIDCGPCRTPLKSLTSDECLRLKTELDKIGFFTFRKTGNSSL